MIEIDIEGFGRWAAFSRIRNLHEQIEGRVNKEIYDQLKEEYPHSELHRLTCGVLRMDARSVTLDRYLAEKVIKYRITGNIKVEAELVDDFEIDEDIWKSLREKRNTFWMDWDGNIPFALDTKQRGKENETA